MVHPLLVSVCGNALLLQQVEGLLGGEGIGGLLGIFGNLQLGGGSNVTAAGADAEGVGACLGEPLAACLVEAGEVAHGDGHRERLTLTGLQLACLGEGLQFLCGLLQTTLGSLDIDLSHFLTSDAASVLDGDADLDGLLALGLHDRLGEARGWCSRVRGSVRPSQSSHGRCRHPFPAGNSS